MSAAMRHSLTSRLAAKARAEARGRGVPPERRSTKLSRSLPLWKRPRRPPAKRRPWSGSLRKRPRSCAANLANPGARASTDPAPATPAPCAAATDDNKWPPLSG